ncbi:MAG: glycosyltransferase [Candidatus Staskawiczbacteria bacterium]
MKILFDNQIFELQKYGGISRYFCELFKKFNNYSDIQYQLPIRNSINEYLSKIEPFNKQDLYPHVTARMRGKTLINKILDIFDKNSNKNIVKKALLEQNFDIFHPTYYSPYFLKYLGSKKLVVTIYDMIHEIYPEYFLSDKGKTINNKRKLVMRADKIIAISESTKKDIIKFYRNLRR